MQRNVCVMNMSMLISVHTLRMSPVVIGLQGRSFDQEKLSHLQSTLILSNCHFFTKLKKHLAYNNKVGYTVMTFIVKRAGGWFL